MTANKLENGVSSTTKKKRNAKRAARRLRAEKTAQTSLPSKPVKKSSLQVDKLPWRPVDALEQLDFDDTGGAMMLEEVEGVEVVYGEKDEQGRRSVHLLTVPTVREPSVNENEEEWVPLSANSPLIESDEEDNGMNEAANDYKANLAAAKMHRFDISPVQDLALPEYEGLSLHRSLRRAIDRLGFNLPTEIQQMVWQAALSSEAQERDIVGVAETGSGKTFAYGLPILHHLVSRLASGSSAAPTELAALILAPTRELAMQVKDHLDRVVRAACYQDEDASYLKLPIHIVAITGGMSIQKQKRMLTQAGGPHIIVATPGRLADLVQQDRELAKAIRKITFLVLDEADRMIEHGHFAELDSLLQLVARKKSADDEYEDDFAHPADSLAALPARDDMRTYVFSATMSKELQRNLKRASRRSMRRKEEKGKLGALGDLLARLDFRDADPLIIDLTPEGGLAARLRECKVDCMVKEKDLFLYYFLLRYPGRTLVFVSSIDSIRRLHPLLELLGLEPGIIHSGMQQRARLKSLDRFRSHEAGLLLATDVAARGLDVPEVKHVVHFQLPRTADTYVHRSGRTARAGREGLSLALCSPEEKSLHRNILKSLERGAEPEDLPVDHSILDQLRHRLALAAEIDKEQHRITKENNDQKWLKKTAEDLDVDMSGGDNSEDDIQPLGMAKSRQARRATAGIGRLKAELRDELARSLRIKGVSAKYLTSFVGGETGLVDSLIDQSNHDRVLGLKRRTAFDDLAARPDKKGRKR